MESDHLIIFAKNPVLGKTKTRLAKSIGHENALKIYLHLLEHTARETIKVPVSRHIYYSSFIEKDDIFLDGDFNKNIQKGTDLGERMYEAFKDIFGQWAEKVIIIGTDCPGLTGEIINDAFAKLDHADAVIGPAEDGGYYLLGFKDLKKEFFMNKEWSSENVMLDTLLDFNKLNLKYEMLIALNDVDYEKDLGSLKALLE